jgi:hypothetical protein
MKKPAQFGVLWGLKRLLQNPNDKNIIPYFNIKPSLYTLTKVAAEGTQVENLPTVDLARPHSRSPCCGMIRFRGFLNFFHRTAFRGFLLGIFARFLPSLNTYL